MSQKQLPKIDLSQEDKPWYEKSPMIQNYPGYSTPQVPSYGGFCDLISSQRRGSLKTEMLPQPQKEINTNSNDSAEDSPLLHIIPQKMLGFSFLSMLEQNEPKKNYNDEELFHPPLYIDIDPNTVPEAQERLEQSPYLSGNAENQYEGFESNEQGDHGSIRRNSRRAVTEVYENPNVHLQYKRIKYRKNRNFDRVIQTESVGDFKMAFEKEKNETGNISPPKFEHLHRNNNEI
eukprot:CAMPEP_0202940868 /NCGR_PEP_ID=MMETSP1395-20130829/993_1 /ASSEMBLY_ACC=CAM_ASM_000871 /TAXON_ID=5961 /ORGANISM="Blepharisma japonicum, Strain Stock R1072" /LENGTH=232 /DNA_ID=CAMNT_0049635613 /DNA_START=17 /DNA_END=715 /DNA_ORIENTATION=+